MIILKEAEGFRKHANICAIFAGILCLALTILFISNIVPAIMFFTGQDAGLTFITNSVIMGALLIAITACIISQVSLTNAYYKALENTERTYL